MVFFISLRHGKEHQMFGLELSSKPFKQVIKLQSIYKNKLAMS
jgi:hypothetical protein